ncbi:arf-GAP with Rho-GAP domain, ANK repeat and PH domain-containing protein 1 isoform X1 [Nothobranchius furzeri]|uniref:Ankyrin repeat and PH domain 1 n=5 Tax=Nothobranchius TaxID=28779 RepID=A0A1A7ZNE7_NOTFU|nr:arf-GAP with Rho-GAP domain, ANK repeat and PH domain-containing protein 1 isoform X1 [Nothobranchius furzeri]XP_054598732.1 arf-GAP with Rho-GAP domain, ANK repeat and PH domain-containing protein 1 isoform X1 [Nothobranchius furzeri]XP_054598733.1 arf-GAP with Rho-GAP domain, ANK repeat and PH domain-containing protein 1 isoform X1 [Nothobranchius furzeri]KAF7219514.1 ankyrin repeat and PH domain 1 [Nothobranchius furzeri]
MLMLTYASLAYKSTMSHSEPSTNVSDWLFVLHLEQYTEAFQSAGLETLMQCLNLTPDQLDRIGITPPGHQKRILSSLSRMDGNHNETLEQKGHTEVIHKESPVSLAEKLDAGTKDGKTRIPTPREKGKPVPKERHVSTKQGKSTKGGDPKPVPGKRHLTPSERKEENRIFGVDKEKDKPVARQRTKFRAGTSVDCPSVFPSSDSSLPPVPPRVTHNCPPLCFTSSQSPSLPTQHSGSTRAEHTILLPPLPCRSSSPCSTCTSTPSATESAFSSTNINPTQRRPQTLAIYPPTQPQSSDEVKKASPIIPVKSPVEEKHIPPIPPKVGIGSKAPPPLPQRNHVPPSRNLSPSGARTEADELKQKTPQVRPRRTVQVNHGQSFHLDTKPAVPRTVLQAQHSSSIDENSDDYEDSDLFFASVNQRTMADEMTLRVPGQRKARSNSLFSDDGLLDDYETWEDGLCSSPNGSFHLPHISRESGGVKEDSSLLSTVIKMGWLEKNPPQGVRYQRRWVKLDNDYLRYFDSDKDVYSKGIISTAFITNVSSVGDLKFEVITSNRTFTFKAENEGERNDWVTTLLECTRGRQRQSIATLYSISNPNFQGYLELRGPRSKLYTIVASDKVFLYKNIDDYRIGVGITSIDMNVGNIKGTDRRSFDLTTPYRVFSFIAESEQVREQWVAAMREAISEALSNSEVVKQIWEEPSNSFCADCGALKPDWASVNLCVVICKSCAGQHRGLGQSISKVRSLKMDKNVWTEELIQVFLKLGNNRVNSFWAANVPPSEALTPSSSNEERQHFISSKYRQGKYRKYHPLYGNPNELNNALCINVQSGDLLETLRLIFCGADVNCSTGMTDCLTLESLASAHSQPLQAELIRLNLSTELPMLHVEGGMDLQHYQPSPCASYNGFLFKTASLTRAVTECKAREEFSRRWCSLNDGSFSYYESDKNPNPNGTLKTSEIVCLVVDTPQKHGYDFTFELYSESERIYLFGTDDPESHKGWVKSIAKSFIPTSAEPLLRLGFERIGRLKCKDGLNLQQSKVGWFALEGSTLHVYLENSKGEEICLRKVSELSIQQDNGVLVLVEKGRTLYIEGERKLGFAGWCAAIQAAGRSGGDMLSEQQLTETNSPIIVQSCIDYVLQYGMTSEGIYRKSGVNSRVAGLCDRFRQDARSLRLKEGEHMVDDVSNTLKRFFRELKDGLFTSEDSQSWLNATDIQDENEKIEQYKLLLDKLPHVNKATLETLINHLYCVQCFSEQNQMNLHNLAIVFGPTLFQTDGQDYTAGRAIEDLIQHYKVIFEVDEQQLNKQLKEIDQIRRLRETGGNKFPTHPRTEQDGHFICTVYLEEIKDTVIEQSVKVPGSMTAAELTYEILDLRKISFTEKDYWCCWEVCSKEETERPLHYEERVLPILHSIGTESFLLIKKHPAMDSMLVYLASKMDSSKHGIMKFREERSILGLGLPTGNFHDRYFVLNFTSLRMYKDVRSNRCEREWPVSNLTIYFGIKKKLRPPTSWGLMVIYESKKQDKPEKQQWYLCCETESEMREWYSTFLSCQYNGKVWSKDVCQQTRASRVLPDTRHGNVSLIPLRGSENEMRNSVAAFSQDQLALLRDLR